LNGSTELGIDCYLPVARYYPSIYERLDRKTRAETREIIERCISMFCSGEEMIQTLTDFTLFLVALDVVKYRSDVRFDPDALMEEFHSLAYRLLTTPDCNLFDNDPPIPESIPNGLASSMGLGYACLKALDCSVRIACILYAKRSNPDRMDMSSKHPVLLGLLEKNLRLVLGSIGNEAEHKFSELSFLLHWDSLEEVQSWKTMIRRLRPALIFVVLTGSHISDLSQTGTGDTTNEKSVYHELLVAAVGETAADVDAVPESDLDLCRLCDLSKLSGKKFHVRDAMKRIIAEYHDQRSQMPRHGGLGLSYLI
jgi:hypothetical protein